MKRYNLLGLLCGVLLTLAGCANNGYSNTDVNKDLSRETWIQKIPLDTYQWTRNADSWFLFGKPTSVEQRINHSGNSQAVTTMAVRVPDFTSIRAEGVLHVQIVGRQEHNSVFIYGPNEAVRQTVAEIRGNCLYIHPVKDSKCADMDQVIIRIGIKNLTNLSAAGKTNIEGKEVTSDGLILTANDSSMILLSGNMNLGNATQAGSGVMTVIGADTPALNIKVTGPGTVNVSGRVGIRTLTNTKGKVNILGADSDSLSISSTNDSVTTVVGYANLKKVSAANNSRVYLYWVNSSGVYVDAHNTARIGLAGATKNLNVDITDSARFEGQYLRADNVYVRTRRESHANVNPLNKMFAAALDYSSIYFFGSPVIVSRYTTGSGSIIPVWNDTGSLPTTSLPPPAVQPTRMVKSYK